MSDRYEETWAEYRKWRNRSLFVLFGFLPLTYLVGLVLHRTLRAA